MTPDQPLAGRTILVTRARRQSEQFRRLLEAAGARVVEIPAIEIQPLHSDELDQAIEKLESYDWLMFTSANSASIVLDQVTRLRADLNPEQLERPKICAIGPATSEAVEDRGYRVSLVPAVFQAEGVLVDFLEFHGGVIGGLRILLPRAAKAREVLPDQLRQKGARLDLIPVYQTALPEGTAETLRTLLREVTIDLVAFTSSSTVENFVQAAGGAASLRSLACAVIGPITGQTAREHGLNVVVQPSAWTVPDLAQAIIDHFRDLELRRSGET
jgi:uroporphyrinogen III methyltransferase/synthase